MYKTNLRITDELASKIKAEALKNNISINTQINALIEAGLTTDTIYNERAIQNSMQNIVEAEERVLMLVEKLEKRFFETWKEENLK